MEKKYKCQVCSKEFNKLDHLKKFIIFNKNDKDFVICKKDLKVILKQLKDISFDKEAYKEHYYWYQKSEKLLEVAKEIYKKCSCKVKTVNLKKIGEDVYDLMCEKCWEKFKQKEKELFPNKGDNN